MFTMNMRDSYLLVRHVPSIEIVYNSIRTWHFSLYFSLFFFSELILSLSIIVRKFVSFWFLFLSFSRYQRRDRLLRYTRIKMSRQAIRFPCRLCLKHLFDLISWILFTSKSLRIVDSHIVYPKKLVSIHCFMLAFFIFWRTNLQLLNVGLFC